MPVQKEQHARRFRVELCICLKRRYPATAALFKHCGFAAYISQSPHPPPVTTVSHLTWQIMQRSCVNLSANTKAVTQSRQQERAGLTRSSSFRHAAEIQGDRKARLISGRRGEVRDHTWWSSCMCACHLDTTLTPVNTSITLDSRSLLFSFSQFSICIVMTCVDNAWKR